MKLINLKIFSSRAKQKKKYFFYFTFFIILFISLFALIYVVPFLKSSAGQYIQSQSPSPSFSFTARGIPLRATAAANGMLVYAVCIVVATTVNGPSGFTEQWRTASDSSTTSEMSQELYASVGATGTIHGTLNRGAYSNITQLIALRPAGVKFATHTPTPPAGRIALRAADAGNNGTGGFTLTLPAPVGTSSGDVMVAHVIVGTAGNTITPPAGWNLVLRQDSSSSISSTTSEMSQEIFSSSGATGTIHGTNSGSTSNVTILIALKPSGG